MKQFVKSVFDRLGLEIRKKSLAQLPAINYCRNEQMAGGLRRCMQRGLQANTIIDVGAAAGSWTKLAMDYWPDAHFLLFEPLQERKSELENLIAINKNCHLVPAAAGKQKGAVNFNVAADLDGSGVVTGLNFDLNTRSVPVTSIEAEIKNLQLPGPYIIKLDTHGFEVPILEGSLSIINEVSLFIIECYGFNITHDSLLFWEMCQYMQTLGFRLVDMVDTLRRPKDEAFWQCDAFFIPERSVLFSNHSYQ